MAAASLALKRLLSSGVLSRSLRPARTVVQPASSRVFSTNAVREYESDDSDDGDVVGRPDRRFFSPFSGVFDPFSRRSNLSQVLNMIDQYIESPVADSGLRRNWDIKEADEGIHLRMDMPGLGKEDVKVSVEQNTLVIKGEGNKDFEDDKAGPRYTSRIDLPDKIYKTDAIKAEMKNGVLKVFLPKIKEEERTDVFQVNVE
ncbi:hypothetical protein ABFS82_06G047300 [Erythranthe guttata]|uniref:SHSP domain-containing protein n=1 Tax=Erythranthe guttata TaxID=4155 RepID=A0A022QEP2_ERYGU|nr:PREDICTED: 23.6 kDa heat shock protein, mitochondrial-like isoform X2 [Erythranthe guttata]EYU24955.1 hypothetical protein MIMGU_mgv1a013209mg [Erythranthe guttata]|eukprot:XP_012852110.1 PREDICTED: 23.6 kDa heat shock protein, mitochondrial-like isoform X2 [Erythranthe guttata]